MEKLVLGDGFQEGVTQGPLINKSQFNKVKNSCPANDFSRYISLRLYGTFNDG
jgi:hypothetical protein